jgi:site-specific DNA recombinase
LNEAGHRTRTGKFSDTTVDRLLRDPLAKGLRRANYTRSLGEKKHWELKPEEDWVHIPVQPIVSEEIWTQCNSILEASRTTGKRPAKPTVHLFSGLAHCSCGAKMFVPSASPKYTCPKCRNKISLSDLEAVFQGELERFFLSPEEIADYIRQSDGELLAKEEVLQGLHKERQKVKAEMDQTYRLYLDGNLSSFGFGQRNTPLEARLKEIDDELPRLQGEVDFLKIQHLSSDQIMTDARSLYSGWERFEPTEKRSIVESLTERVTVGKDEVSFEMSYAPYTPKDVTNKQHNLTGSSRPPT